MNTTRSADSAQPKGKKAIGGSRLPPLPSGRPAGPTTFFLKTEKDLEHSQQRGRKTSRSAVMQDDQTPAGSMAAGSSFGVQSLDSAIHEGSLSRTASNSSTQSSDSHGELSPARGKKRKSGNRVHPTILATGQRIISSDRSSSVMSPKVGDSPSGKLLFRHNSGASAGVSAPLTPIKLSPHREAVSPMTPRSGSPKSFKLSDEEISVRDETGSQAICSSSDECQSPDLERTPQLVMPSLAMPVRRPFTEQGRRIGRAKIMVVGPKRVGKTSFIHSLFRSSEHIVHMDQVTPSIPSQSSFMTESSHYMPTTMFNEIGASTRSYPSWWTDMESRHTLHRRLSVGEGVLERNLTFVDTPGLEGVDQILQILSHVKLTLQRTAHMESMSDSEVISLLSGDGGVQIDAVIYLFEPKPPDGEEQPSSHHGVTRDELLRYLGKWMNLIPVIAQADTLPAEALVARKNEVAEYLNRLKIPRFELTDVNLANTSPALPLGISSAPGDDTEEVDASVLMSSQYLRPLATSELGSLVNTLLEPSNIARMRHTSAMKFLLWRQQNDGKNIDSHKQSLLQSAPLGYHSRVTSAGSLIDDPSKVLVPHSSSSYYRSASPAISDISGQLGPGTGASTQALAHYNEQTQAQQPTEPFRQVRLAKWAQDLQRSLNNERRKYEPLCTDNVTGWPSAESEKNDQALVSTGECYRSKRGRLGGDLSVFDPRDPLGVLALGQTVRQRGIMLLQVIGGASLLGAAAYWIVRNWLEVQSFLGIGQQPSGIVATTAIPPPAPQRSGHWLDEEYLREIFSWGR